MAMSFLIASALSLSSPLAPSTSSEPVPDLRREAIETAQPETVIGQEPAASLPGQFASAFPDVYPTDWAYQAVNRLASRPAQCFDLPPESGVDSRPL